MQSHATDHNATSNVRFTHPSAGIKCHSLCDFYSHCCRDGNGQSSSVNLFLAIQTDALPCIEHPTVIKSAILCIRSGNPRMQPTNLPVCRRAPNRCEIKKNLNIFFINFPVIAILWLFFVSLHIVTGAIFQPATSRLNPHLLSIHDRAVGSPVFHW